MKKYSQLFLYTGYLALLLSVVIYPSHIDVADINIAIPIEIIGTILLTIYRICAPIKTGDGHRDKRLQFQQFISSALLLLTAYLMYSQDSRWVISLLVAVTIDAINAFRLPKTIN